MTMILENIKEFTENWKIAIKQKVATMPWKPELYIYQVGNNEASNRYIRNKIKDCNEVNITTYYEKFDEDISEEELINSIKEVQNYEPTAGIIVQLPLPSHINKDKVAQAINPEADVDGFKSDSKFIPCTPGGIMEYLRYCGWEFSGKNVLIIGRSDIVGKPLAQMMTDADATVTLCHSKTRNLWEYVEMADLIVCAVGKPQFLNCYSIHVPVIDVGINFDENGKLVGDCYNTEGRDVTPVPGGVGLLTRCMLLENLIMDEFEEWDKKIDI